MGAGSSRPGGGVDGDGGIVTVRRASSAASAAAVEAGASVTEPLLRHLESLRAQAPQLGDDAAALLPAAAPAAAPAAGAGEPAEGLLGEVRALQALAANAGELDASLSALLGGYRRRHEANAAALAGNQDYIGRIIDQAEAKAARAVRHVQAQAGRLRALSAGLADAAALPALLRQLAATTAALQEQLEQLEALAAAVAGCRPCRSGGPARSPAKRAAAAVGPAERAGGAACSATCRRGSLLPWALSAVTGSPWLACGAPPCACRVPRVHRWQRPGGGAAQVAQVMR